MPIRIPEKKPTDPTAVVGGGGGGGGSDNSKTHSRRSKKLSRSLKRKREDTELQNLEKEAQEFDPKRAKDFTDLPISKPTAAGLDKSHFKTLTDIQRRAIPLALKGKDILGAAKTGSGKTLAFLVPLLEVLYRKKWTQQDGLGALVISPTRELAVQIFEVLRKVGQRHSFSAGLVIGGKSLQEEKERLGRMNILVCTPGRMLQHLDQNAELEINNVQLLVLDEADRILDMGFKSTIDAILQSIPKERQTLLFSATQTKNVSDLARLSLTDPEYVAVHETASSATPKGLQQHYIVTPLHEKLDVLWSFIRANTKAKMLVFLSSTKQVRFVYETFRQMQPGIPLLHLHGKQKQTARADVTSRFSSSKNSCLLATDVVARGLDFPAVDWVVQVDCPEDADTYIHRVGRTARYEKEGKAVLFLCPSEETGMLKRLESKKVPIGKINVKQNKKMSIKNQLQGICFKDPEIKYLAQKAFASYMRSIYVQKDKDVFKLEELPVQEYADSLGLPGAPKIKFMKGIDVKAIKNAPRGLNMSDDSEEEPKEKKKEVRTKYDRMFERQNQDVLTGHYTGMVKHTETNDDEDGDGDFLQVKRRLSDATDLSSSDEGERDDNKTRTINVPGKGDLVIDSKRRAKMVTSKKAMLKFRGKGTKLVYDEDGMPHNVYEFDDEEKFKEAGPAEEQRSKFLTEEAERVAVADLDDRQLAKEKKRMKKEKRKMRMREQEDDVDEEDGGVALPVLSPIPIPEGEDEEQEEEGRKPKRQKKWFEDDSDEEKKKKKKKHSKKRIIEAQDAPETLEDLENLASGLLG